MDRLLQIIKSDLSNLVISPNIDGREVLLKFDVENLGIVFSKLFSYKGVSSRLRDIAVIPFVEGHYKIVYNIFISDEMISLFLETEIKGVKSLPSITKFYKNANFLERKIKSIFGIDIKNSVMDCSMFFREGICIK